MAAFSSKYFTVLVFCIVLALSLSHVSEVSARKAPESKKQTDCFGIVGGTTVFPSIGRTEIPPIGGLDNSGPAAANGQYIPGADDTFVPNPGYEVPNPFHG